MTKAVDTWAWGYLAYKVKKPCSDQSLAVVTEYCLLRLSKKKTLLSSFPCSSLFTYSGQGYEHYLLPRLHPHPILVKFNITTEVSIILLPAGISKRYIPTYLVLVFGQYLTCPPQQTKPTVFSLQVQKALPLLLFIYKHPFLATSRPRPNCLLSFCTPARPTCFLPSKRRSKGNPLLRA